MIKKIFINYWFYQLALLAYGLFAALHPEFKIILSSFEDNGTILQLAIVTFLVLLITFPIKGSLSKIKYIGVITGLIFNIFATLKILHKENHLALVNIEKGLKQIESLSADIYCPPAGPAKRKGSGSKSMDALNALAVSMGQVNPNDIKKNDKKKSKEEKRPACLNRRSDEIQYLLAQDKSLKETDFTDSINKKGSRYVEPWLHYRHRRSTKLIKDTYKSISDSSLKKKSNIVFKKIKAQRDLFDYKFMFKKPVNLAIVVASSTNSLRDKVNHSLHQLLFSSETYPKYYKSESTVYITHLESNKCLEGTDSFKIFDKKQSKNCLIEANYFNNYLTKEEQSNFIPICGSTKTIKVCIDEHTLKKLDTTNDINLALARKILNSTSFYQEDTDHQPIEIKSLLDLAKLPHLSPKELERVTIDEKYKKLIPVGLINRKFIREFRKRYEKIITNI